VSAAAAVQRALRSARPSPYDVGFAILWALALVALAAGGDRFDLTFGLVGYFAGQTAADAITQFGVYAFIVLAVLAVGGYALYRWRGQRSAEES